MMERGPSTTSHQLVCSRSGKCENMQLRPWIIRLLALPQNSYSAEVPTHGTVLVKVSK